MESSLPDEVLSAILSFLTPEELATSELVCWRWKTLAHSLWRRLAISYLATSGLELSVAQQVVEKVRGGKGHDDGRRLFRMVRGGLLEASTAQDLLTKPNLKDFVNMAHGPMYSSDYWFLEHDPSASHERAMVLRRVLWFFGVTGHKTVLESGTYSCVWRMKLTPHARTSQLRFSVAGVPGEFALSNEVQERLRGRGWFYVAIGGVEAQAGQRIGAEMKQDGEMKTGYSVDCMIFLPADLLQESLPADRTFWFNH